MLVNGELKSAQIEGFDFVSLPAPSLMNRRVVFDKTNKRALISDGVQWRPTGSTGGSGALRWVDGVPAPTQIFEDGMLKYVFDQMIAQKESTSIKIPSLYVGSQIKLKFGVQSSDTVGNVTINVVATLVRSGVDTMSSTTHQHTYSHTINLSGSTVDIPQEVVATLTNASGHINSIPVSPGDYIKIEINRDAGDMSTEGLKYMLEAAELIFD